MSKNYNILSRRDSFFISSVRKFENVREFKNEVIPGCSLRVAAI